MSDGASIQVRPTLARSGSPLADPRVQLAALQGLSLAGGPRADFDACVEEAGLGPLSAAGLQVLQVNLGKRCNQTGPQQAVHDDLRVRKWA